jgi:hypothetical protein
MSLVLAAQAVVQVVCRDSHCQMKPTIYNLRELTLDSRERGTMFGEAADWVSRKASFAS